MHVRGIVVPQTLILSQRDVEAGIQLCVLNYVDHNLALSKIHVYHQVSGVVQQAEPLVQTGIGQIVLVEA